jgi:hypothetical protein
LVTLHHCPFCIFVRIPENLLEESVKGGVSSYVWILVGCYFFFSIQYTRRDSLPVLLLFSGGSGCRRDAWERGERCGEAMKLTSTIKRDRYSRSGASPTSSIHRPDAIFARRISILTLPIVNPLASGLIWPLRGSKINCLSPCVYESYVYVRTGTYSEIIRTFRGSNLTSTSAGSAPLSNTEIVTLSSVS